jgi:hypothetical protein
MSEAWFQGQPWWLQAIIVGMCLVWLIVPFILLGISKKLDKLVLHASRSDVRSLKGFVKNKDGA